MDAGWKGETWKGKGSAPKSKLTSVLFASSGEALVGTIVKKTIGHSLNWKTDAVVVCCMHIQ
jgi:hypothetical protein